MSELTLIVMALSGTVAVMGYLIRRAITLHDVNETATQAMIAENTKQITDIATEAMRVAERQHQVMTEILTEAKLTNHRITVLEATEMASRRSHGHQQRGDSP